MNKKKLYDDIKLNEKGLIDQIDEVTSSIDQSEKSRMFVKEKNRYLTSFMSADYNQRSKKRFVDESAVSLAGPKSDEETLSSLH